MARNELSTLGIDLGGDEIRIVQTESKGGRTISVRANAFPLPPGAIAHGIIMEPGTLVVALRRAVEALGTLGTTRAVVGISGEQTNYRTVTVPPCPDDEVPELVAGEVEQHGALGLAGGPYDHFPLYPAKAPSDAMRTMAVVGVDAQVTQGLNEILESVGIGVAAFEPTPLAMLRTGVAGLPADATTFVLVVGPSLTDAAYFVKGKLAAYRRLEIGANMLVQSVMPTAGFGDPDSLYGGPLEAETFEGWSHVDQASVDSLAVEAQRTMEYVQREDRDGAEAQEVLLVVDDPEVEPLASMLERRIGLPTRVVRPRCEDSDGRGVDRFSAAYGLAIRPIHSGVGTPAIDLFSSHRTEARRVETKRNFLGAVLVSGLSLAVGLGACALYNGQIGQVTRRSASATAQIESVNKATDAVLSARGDEAARYKALRKEGVPLGTVMDYVVGSVDPGVGLKFVAVNDELKVRVAGEARDVTALARTTQALQTSPVLLNVALERFDRDTKKPDSVLTFEISAETISADRLKIKGKNL